MLAMKNVPKLRRGQHLSEQQRVEVGRKLLKDYEAGASIRQLRDHTGYSIGRIRRMLEAAGVEYRNRGGATQRSSTR